MEKVSRLHLLLLALLISLALPGVSFAQDLRVQGCVTDEMNEPLVGVSVQTKDKSKGTVTDIAGKYVLSGVPQGSTLVFSYVGFTPKEVKVTSAK
ncbi:MAG: carboxypeptidase-like regulatory domain-containing protein, partial [Muribaculaceae bacterium]|nr:carboxypeptidase-like regulatory domain-containing protein [Muribaculaceae bacterium]